MNPQHTFPMLVDNGTIIYDSHAIMGYLCDKYATDDKLYPKELVPRAQINSRLHFDTGCLFARFRFMLEAVFKRKETNLEPYMNSIEQCYPILEGFLENHPFVCGDELSVADFSCFASVYSMDKYVPIDNDKYPKSRAWVNRMNEIPFVKELNEPGAVELKAMIEGAIAANAPKSE